MQASQRRQKKLHLDMCVGSICIATVKQHALATDPPCTLHLCHANSHTLSTELCCCVSDNPTASAGAAKENISLASNMQGNRSKAKARELTSEPAVPKSTCCKQIPLELVSPLLLIPKYLLTEVGMASHASVQMWMVCCTRWQHSTVNAC